MPSRAKISAAEFVQDLRAGLTSCELMNKYSLIARELDGVLAQLKKTFADPADIYGRIAPSGAHRKTDKIRFLRRHKIDLPVLIYEAKNPTIRGEVQDVSENGIGVEGMDTKVGEIKSLVVLANEYFSIDPFGFDAQCLWTNSSPNRGHLLAGFEIIKITEEGRKSLARFIETYANVLLGQSLFDKLMEAGLIKQSHLDDRTPSMEKTVDLELIRCPACDMPQFTKFDECPQCGVIVSKYRRCLAERSPEFSARPSRTDYYKLEGIHRLKGLKWKFKTGGWIAGSPIVHEEVVYFGSHDEVVYGLLRSSGKVVWHFKTSGPVHSSPAVFGNALYITSLDGSLCALELLGEKKWQFKTGGPVYSSPVISYGLAYFGSLDGRLYAVDSVNGTEQWHLQTDDRIYSSPAVAKDTVFCTSMDGNLYASNAFTGQILWKFCAEGPVSGTPVIDEETVYFGCMEGNLYALDISSGSEKWRFKTEGKITCTPAIGIATLYFGSHNGTLYAVWISTGQEKWHFDTGGPVTCSPSVGHGGICIGSKDKNLYSLDYYDGHVNWKFATDAPIFSSPAIIEGVIYFGSDDGHLYVLH